MIGYDMIAKQPILKDDTRVEKLFESIYESQINSMDNNSSQMDLVQCFVVDENREITDYIWARQVYRVLSDEKNLS